MSAERDEWPWWDVLASIKVRAPDGDAAINRVARAVRGEESLQGVFPVADFGVRETEDPLETIRRRQTGGEGEADP